MSFGEPIYFALLVTIPLAVLVFAYAGWSRRRAASRFAGMAAGNARRGRRAVSSVLLLASLVLIAIAAARPQWGEEEATIHREGVDVVVALDTSLSMMAEDVEPNRLGAAKLAIDDLFDALRGDRVGLVVFGGNALVRFPLTTDIDAARHLLQTTVYDEQLGPGSNPASAINAARSAFLDGGTATRVLLLVTDGEQLVAASGEATDVQLEIDRALEEDVRIIVVGVGTEEGGTIPVVDEATGAVTLRLDPATGAPAVSRLDSEALQGLAEAAEGEYVDLSEGEAAPAIADRIAQMEASAFFEADEAHAIERFQIFAGAALGLIALQPLLVRLVPHRARRRRTVAISVTGALLGLLLVACGGDETASLIREGNEHYEGGEYEAALERYREAQVQRPDLAELNYNAANALFRLGETERAIEEGQRALNTDEPDTLGRAYYSLGNFYASLNRWQEARAAYRNSLIYEPTDVDAKYNLEVANRQLGSTPPEGQPPTEGEEGEGQGQGEGQPGASPTPGAEGTATPPPGGTAGPGEGTPADATPGAGQPGGLGDPSGSALPEDTSENPANISDEERAALREALGQLDPGEAYSVEDALRILEMLRDAREGRITGLPVVPAVPTEPDW
ncbi:MAG TPA: VWA domain-containing protein [Dehalococcoidia bacterium]|nr:VWA domain-containing protein [Dehalococcoidia bacterium]